MTMATTEQFRIKWVDDRYSERESGLLRVEDGMYVLDEDDDDNPGCEAQITREESWVIGCGSCGEDGSEVDECPKSERPCGHHCNHVWTHDECDWCGKTFAEEASTNE